MTDKEIEGQVFLRLLVDTTGGIADVKVIKSLNELLDVEAIKAARQWRFSPARQRDKAVRVWVEVPVRFQLDK